MNRHNSLRGLFHHILPRQSLPGHAEHDGRARHVGRVRRRVLRDGGVLESGDPRDEGTDAAGGRGPLQKEQVDRGTYLISQDIINADLVSMLDAIAGT